MRFRFLPKPGVILLFVLLSVMTSAGATTIFTEGFNNLTDGEWTAHSGILMDLDSAVNHGDYTGANSVTTTTITNTYSMYHRIFALTPGFQQGRYEGWMYDGAASGNSRNAIQAGGYDQGGTQRWRASLGTENVNYYQAALYSGSWNKQNTGVNRSIGWHKFAIEINSTGIYYYVDDMVTPKVTIARPSQLNGGYGWTRLYLGFPGYAANAQAWYDDLTFSADAPPAPTGFTGTPTVNSIAFTWGGGSDNKSGFYLKDENETTLGTYVRTVTSTTQTGLTPNTRYTRKLYAYNGTELSPPSNTVTVCTLAYPPSAITINSSSPKETWLNISTPVTFTAVGGFGPGRIEYYKYVWDTNPTHTWDESEAVWNTGDLTVNATAAGSYYLHVKAYNADNVGSATYDAGPFYFGQELEKVWEYDTGTAIASSPTVDLGTVYIGNDAGKVFAGAAGTGTLAEIASIGAAIKSRLAVYGSNLYFTAADGKAYSVSTSGTVNWSQTIGGTGLKSTPAVWNGLVFVGSDDGKLYKLDAATGAVLGSLDLQSGPISSSPAVPPTNGGRIIVGTDSGKVFVVSSFFDVFLDVSCGTSAKGSPVADWITGDFYVGTNAGITKRSISTGSEAWFGATTGEVAVSPWANMGGSAVFAATQNGGIYAFNVSDGTVITGYPVSVGSGAFNGAPVKIPGASAGEYLYAAATSGVFSVNAADGSALAFFGGTFNSSPSVSGVTSSDVVVVGGANGKVYGLRVR